MEIKKWNVNGKMFEANEPIQYIEENNPIQEEFKEDGYLRNAEPKNNPGKVYVMGYSNDFVDGKCIITTRDKLFKIE